jgi:hypothetical protein
MVVARVSPQAAAHDWHFLFRSGNISRSWKGGGLEWKDAVGKMVPFCWYYRFDPTGTSSSSCSVVAA